MAQRLCVVFFIAITLSAQGLMEEISLSQFPPGTSQRLTIVCNPSFCADLVAQNTGTISIRRNGNSSVLVKGQDPSIGGQTLTLFTNNGVLPSTLNVGKSSVYFTTFDGRTGTSAWKMDLSGQATKIATTGQEITTPVNGTPQKVPIDFIDSITESPSGDVYILMGVKPSGAKYDTQGVFRVLSPGNFSVVSTDDQYGYGLTSMGGPIDRPISFDSQGGAIYGHANGIERTDPTGKTTQILLSHGDTIAGEKISISYYLLNGDGNTLAVTYQEFTDRNWGSSRAAVLVNGQWKRVFTLGDFGFNASNISAVRVSGKYLYLGLWHGDYLKYWLVDQIICVNLTTGAVTNVASTNDKIFGRTGNLMSRYFGAQNGVLDAWLHGPDGGTYVGGTTTVSFRYTPAELVSKPTLTANLLDTNPAVGDKVKIDVKSGNAANVSGDHGLGQLPLNGTVEYTVTDPVTTLTFTAVGPGGTTTFSLTINAGPQRPVFTANAIVDAADGSAALTPGKLVSIYGQFDDQTAQASTVPLPTQLGGKSVYITGSGRLVQVPLLYVSPGMVNAQLPADMIGELSVQILNGTSASSTATISVNADPAPSFFRQFDNGLRAMFYDAITYQATNREDNPLRPGSYVFGYAQGLGPTECGTIPAGTVNPPQACRTINTVAVSIGGVSIPVDYAGLAPGLLSGIYQVNFRVPEGLPLGEITIQMAAGNRTTSAPGQTGATN